MLHVAQRWASPPEEMLDTSSINEDTVLSPRKWGEELEAHIQKWLKIPWEGLRSTADLMQRLAWCELEIEKRQFGKAFEGVLKGVLYALALSTIERSPVVQVPRMAQVRAGNLCQRHLLHMEGIPAAHRRLLYAAIVSHKFFMAYCIGAIAVARVRWAVGQLGRRFKLASLYDAEHYGIEAWIESQWHLIPIQIQASRGTHASEFSIVTPESGIPVEDRMTFAWSYLTAGGLPERILLLDVDAYEGDSGRGGAASVRFDQAYGLIEALHAGLKAMES